MTGDPSTAFSACLTKVCSIYDKRIVYPNLFTFITARASAGKGLMFETEGGTPAQVRSLIKDAENGLFSRFMFYYLNVKSEWHDVFDAGSGMALDEYFRQIGEEFYSLYKLIQSLQGVRVEMTADQRSRFNAYFADIQTRQLQFSDTLPESFDRKENNCLAQILGIPTPSADRYIKKWLSEGRLEKVEHGKYRKRGNEW